MQKAIENNYLERLGTWGFVADLAPCSVFSVL